jgi:ATP-dependent Clp protease protease subunit
VEFLYTIDPNSDEPIMTILGEIGADVKGDQFCKELLFLDTLGKSKINVWIHSEGGSVMDGERIFASILKTKTKVDTHNIGLCASSASWIFLAGRNRYMMSNAKVMVHDVSGGYDKATKAFQDSVVTALALRSGLTEETIRTMMANETWMTAEECQRMGLCKIDDIGQMNLPRVANKADYASIVNTLIETHKPKNTIHMKGLCNKLGVIEGANESTLEAAIDAIINRSKSAESKLATQETENKTRVDELNNKLSAAEKKAKEAEDKLVDIANKAAEKEKADKEKEVKDTVANLVKAGKIKNDATAIAAAEKMATADLAAFNEFYKEAPVNKSAPGKLGEGIKTTGTGGYTAEGLMAEMAIKNKQL